MYTFLSDALCTYVYLHHSVLEKKKLRIKLFFAETTLPPNTISHTAIQYAIYSFRDNQNLVRNRKMVTDRVVRRGSNL